MSPHIVLAGVDYHSAPLEVREELSFTHEETLALLPELKRLAGVQEAFVLSTCNRAEFYLSYVGPSPVDPALLLLRRLRPHARALHQDCLRFLELEDDAARHLFRVAAGIASQILGDTHIVTQIKQAHRLATEAGTLGPFLDRMVTESLRAAKRARRETAIGKGSASVGAAVLRSIRHAFFDPTTARVLVLGAGEAGRDIARHLGKARLASLAFAARNSAQAAAMAREFNGHTIEWGQVPETLAHVDTLVTATAARLDILSRGRVRGAVETREAPLLIVDAGVPRNVDPAVAELPNVQLLNLDSLVGEQLQALEARRREVPLVESILALELDRWRRWRESRSNRVLPAAVAEHSYA